VKEHYLVMKWDYKYDKESTWFDEDSGEEQYELKEGASYTLPHIKEKSLEIRSVKTAGASSKPRYTWITTRIPCAKTASLLSAMQTTIIRLQETLFRNRFA